MMYSVTIGSVWYILWYENVVLDELEDHGQTNSCQLCLLSVGQLLNRCVDLLQLISIIPYYRKDDSFSCNFK